MLVDDHAIVRAGVKATLESEPDIEVVAECGTGTDAYAAAEEVRPDVCVIDVTLPGRNGVDLVRDLAQLRRPLRTLMLTMHVEGEFVIGAFQAGANGYAVKTMEPALLCDAVRAVARGQSFISPQVADVVLQMAVNGGAPAQERLTPRERQVLQMVAEGMNAKEIAAELGISDKTVHAFRGQLMKKLEIGSVAELTKYAIRHGLTSLA
jgi:DNA-binding NarL/FixJ family response regulator